METLNLNLIPTGANPVAHVSQYDEGRVIRFNLFEGSAVYTLDGTETIECDVKKPDGNVVTLGVTNTSDSYVEVTTTLQTCACAGESLADIKITKGAVIIATLNFILDVERSPLENGIESDSAIHNLETQIAEAVADQYDADSVIFDNTPTAGHGVGYAVTSEGIESAIPKDLDDLSDVTYTGAPAMGEAVVWDGSKWTNGTVSTVGSIDDLNDVDTTGKAEGDSLRYDSGSGDWVAKPIVIEVTQAEYDQLVLDGDLQPLTTYVITDAPNLNATAQDISYDGSTDTVWDKVESKQDALAVSTDTITEDTTYISTVNTKTVRKYGNLVEVTYTFLCKGFTGTFQNKTFGTIPSGFRPAQSTPVVGMMLPNYTAAGANYPIQFQIENSGIIRTPNNGANGQLSNPSTNTQIILHCVYIM